MSEPPQKKPSSQSAEAQQPQGSGAAEGKGRKEPVKKDKKDMTAEEKKKLKEERRLLQEQQREAKAAKSGSQSAAPKAGAKVGPQPAQRQQAQQKQNKVVARTEAQKKVPLFLHLKQHEREGSLTKKVGFAEADAQRVHPQVVALGLRYAEGIIRGADARCVAMLQTFSRVVRDFSVPHGDSFPRALTKHLSAQFVEYYAI